jgi:hypothetical protein
MIRASEAASDSAVELTATVAFTRRGSETKLVLAGLAPQKHGSRCDPALIKAIARGRAWFEELATGRARSLHERPDARTGKNAGGLAGEPALRDLAQE